MSRLIYIITDFYQRSGCNRLSEDFFPKGKIFGITEKCRLTLLLILSSVLGHTATDQVPKVSLSSFVESGKDP